jgi:hypothetical protein
VLAPTSAQFEVLRAQGGFEDEEIEIDLRRGGRQMREGIGDARGWDVGLRSIYRRGAFNYLVQPCLRHVGSASARDVLDDLNRSEDEGYGSMLVDIGFLVGFVKFISYGDNDGDDDGDGRSSCMRLFVLF